jgi:hypothetical protein
VPEKQTADELAREARLAGARAKAARNAESIAANDPDRATRLRASIAESEDPDARGRYAVQKHRGSPAYAEARKHSTEALGEVRETIVQMRARGIDELDPADRRELIQRVGEGVSARMAERLRTAAAEMLDSPSADLNAVDEI